MNTNFTSSTSFTQTICNFNVLRGLKEDESSEDVSSDETASESNVDVKEEPVLDSQDDVKNSSSFASSSFESSSSESSLSRYDPVTNYLLPRPKFLKYNPARHRDIVDRQEKLNRILDHFAKKTKEIVEESVGDREEHEDEDEEEFDDDKWSSKVFLQYLLVMTVLILMTLTISSMNSPHVSPVSIHDFNVTEIEGEFFSHVTLMVRYLNDRETDKGYKKRNHTDLSLVMRHEHPTDVCENDEVEDLEIVETVKNNEIDLIEHEPVIVTSEQIDTYRNVDENEAYVDLDSSDVDEVSEILKPFANKDDSNKSLNVNENEIDGEENSNNVKKMAYFDPLLVAYSVITVVILAFANVLYYSVQTDTKEGFDESNSVECFGSKSSRFSEYHEAVKDASSSNQTTHFDFQQSTGHSHSHGSFTTEKKIVKRQRSKTSEEVVSTVRRSSRIHNRSISSRKPDFL